MQVELTGNLDHDAFVFQILQSFVEIANTQPPAIAKSVHFDPRAPLAPKVDLQGKEQVVSLALLHGVFVRQQFQVANRQPFFAI
ncbi:MAG: hypothetical protein KME43_18295 [Myxacorys chilensis ATA2-1-KO14]|nr:hypothetical protein [Myxacorys chilensis ATA2-1-KO14]